MRPFHPLLGVALLLLATPLAAGEIQYQSSTGSQVFNLQEPCPANELDFEMAFVLPDGFPLPEGGRNNSVQCTVTAGMGGRLVKGGVSVRMEGELVDIETGNVLRTLPAKTRTINNAARFSWAAVAGATGQRLAAVITGELLGNMAVDNAVAACRWQSLLPCRRDQDTACLFGNGRFQVEVDWQDFNGTMGSGRVLRQVGNTAEFWFFNPNNVELILKVLNSCSDNNHFWVFASSLTNVEFDVTVTDTQSGTVRTYGNPLGAPLEPIVDTAAFATCP